MASVKSLFDTHCGVQAPIVSLSKSFAQSNILLSTDSTFHAQPLALANISSQSDLITQEYLQKINAQTNAPNTFNMMSLLQQCLSSSSSSSPIKFDNRIEARSLQSVNSHLYESWSNEFLKNVSKKQDFSKFCKDGNESSTWINSYMPNNLKNADAALMNNVWNQQQNIGGDTNVLAFDFLDRFDTTRETAVHNNLSKLDVWTNDFVKKHWEKPQSASLFDYKELNDDAYEIFSRYENEWKNIQLNTYSSEIYSFKLDNSFINETEPINKAKELFSQGNIFDAILCYESALQRNPQDAETWCLLGLCQAENEQDNKAILAYQRSLEIDPRMRCTLLASAVSLANEGLENEALKHLDRWITIFNDQSAETPTPSVLQSFVDDSFVVNKVWIQKLEEKFVTASNIVSNSVNLASKAAELQNALGVFYNLTQNYDKAIDAVRSAIAIIPKDPVLWNRLGASLANNDRSAEAISAYRKALELFPAFVRARYNLGVSCMNLSAYKDAFGHFLNALRLQNSQQNSQIWSKLRSCVIRTPEFSDSSSNWSTDALNAIEYRDIETLTKLNIFNH